MVGLNEFTECALLCPLIPLVVVGFFAANKHLDLFVNLEDPQALNG